MQGDDFPRSVLWLLRLGVVALIVGMLWAAGLFTPAPARFTTFDRVGMWVLRAVGVLAFLWLLGRFRLWR